MPRRNSTSRQADRHRHRHSESAGRTQHRKQRARRQRPETSSEATRESQPLSVDALARLERENARQKRKAEKTRKSRGASYQEVDQEPRRERAKERARHRDGDRHQKRERQHEQLKPSKGRGKKRRVVSGAIMEEGRVESGLRGGRNEEWRWSDQSYTKEEYYRPKRQKKSRKKLCGFSNRLA